MVEIRDIMMEYSFTAQQMKTNRTQATLDFIYRELIFHLAYFFYYLPNVAAVITARAI